jgi:hypothetical protein
MRISLLLQHVWKIIKELKHVLSSFLTKMVVCSRMCFNTNLSKSFNHTNDKHAKMIKVCSNISSLNLFMCISCLSLFLGTNQHLLRERLWIKCTQRKYIVLIIKVTKTCLSDKRDVSLLFITWLVLGLFVTDPKSTSSSHFARTKI